MALRAVRTAAWKPPLRKSRFALALRGAAQIRDGFDFQAEILSYLCRQAVRYGTSHSFRAINLHEC